MVTERGAVVETLDIQLQKIKTTDNIIAQMETFMRCADLGLTHRMTEEDFPDLYKEDPLLCALEVIRSIDFRRRKVLNSGILICTDPDASNRVALQLRRLDEETMAVVKKFMPESDGEERINFPFCMRGDGDEATLRTAIEYGLVEEINPSSIPSLATLAEADVIKLKLLAISTDVVIWRNMKSESQTTMGFPPEGSKVVSTDNMNELADMMIKERASQKERLSRQLLDLLSTP